VEVRHPSRAAGPAVELKSPRTSAASSTSSCRRCRLEDYLELLARSKPRPPSSA
jgi:hypothetical protein